MLSQLYIKNIAVISELPSILARASMSLPGETGAGKSILIDALGIVLGGRAPSDAVRTGADAYQIQAVFDVTGIIPWKPSCLSWGSVQKMVPIFTPPLRTGKKPGLCQ